MKTESILKGILVCAAAPIMVGCATSVIPTSYIQHPDAGGADGTSLCWIKPGVSLQSFKNIVVEDFATDKAVGITPGVNPNMLASTLRDLLIAELDRCEKNAVSDRLDAPKGEAFLLIEGNYAQINPGNRAMRYMVGLGAGRALIDVEIKVSDAGGEERMFVAEFGVTATKSMGVWGGSSDKFLDDCLRRIAKVIAVNVTRK